MESVRKFPRNPKLCAKWVINYAWPMVKEGKLVYPGQVASVVDMLECDLITHATAKDVLTRSVDTLTDLARYLIGASDEEPTQDPAYIDPAYIVGFEGLEKKEDDGALLKVVLSVLESNEDKVEQYRSGKTNVVNFFVGQSMRACEKGTDAGTIRQLIEKELMEVVDAEENAQMV